MTLALLTKTSILPHARTTESITRLHPASSLMSWGKRRHWPPEAVTRDLAASASRCSSGRYTIATYQPIMREMIRIDHEGRLTSAPSMAYIAATALPIPDRSSSCPASSLPPCTTRSPCPLSHLRSQLGSCSFGSMYSPSCMVAGAGFPSMSF